MHGSWRRGNSPRPVWGVLAPIDLAVAATVSGSAPVTGNFALESSPPDELLGSGLLLFISVGYIYTP